MVCLLLTVFQHSILLWLDFVSTMCVEWKLSITRSHRFITQRPRATTTESTSLPSSQQMAARAKIIVIEGGWQCASLKPHRSGCQHCGRWRSCLRIYTNFISLLLSRCCQLPSIAAPYSISYPLLSTACSRHVQASATLSDGSTVCIRLSSHVYFYKTRQTHPRSFSCHVM